MPSSELSSSWGDLEERFLCTSKGRVLVPLSLPKGTP